jgi:hypothetical protein
VVDLITEVAQSPSEIRIFSPKMTEEQYNAWCDEHRGHYTLDERITLYDSVGATNAELLELYDSIWEIKN